MVCVYFNQLVDDFWYFLVSSDCFNHETNNDQNYLISKMLFPIKLALFFCSTGHIKWFEDFIQSKTTTTPTTKATTAILTMST